MGAYSYELITPERKHISECLKWLWNRKTIRDVGTGVDIGIYTPKISPSKLFMG